MECSHHGELTGAVKAQEAYSKMHHESITKLFELINGLKTSVDQNEIRATGRDDRLAEIKDLVKDMSDKWESFHETMVNNTTDLFTAVNTMGACLERRKAEREKRIAEEQEFSVWTKTGKAVARSINHFVEKWIPVMILCTMILFVIYIVLWLNYGGDGKILLHIHKTLDSVLGW